MRLLTLVYFSSYPHYEILTFYTCNVGYYDPITCAVRSCIFCSLSHELDLSRRD